MDELHDGREMDIITAADTTTYGWRAPVEVWPLAEVPEAPAAPTDRVTGLLSSTAFHAAFEQTVGADRGCSLALLDLDGFAQVNQEHGRHVGDEILHLVAAVLTSVFRGTDVLARWEDDTFVVLFPNTARAGAVRAVEKALRALQSEPFYTPAGQTVRLTASAGITEVDAPLPLEAVIENADRFLVIAQVMGGGRIHSRGGEVVPAEATILLLEDDAVSAAVVRHRLERAGHRVIHFADGTTAMAQVGNEPVSLILLDLNMGGVDGLGAIARMRKMPRLKKVPIVVLSKVESEADLVRCFQLGADDYVMRPFSPAELIARIQRLLRGR